MDKYERTIREERWMLTDELFAASRPEPPEVAAFRLLQENDWDHFMTNVIDNPAMKFFNPEIPDFSSAASWEELCALTGVRPFPDEVAIPDTVGATAHDFCRDLRNAIRQSEDEWYDGCKVFYDHFDWLMKVMFEFSSPEVASTQQQVSSPCCLLVIHHTVPCLQDRFNSEISRNLQAYREVDAMLKARGLYRETLNRHVTIILRDAPAVPGVREDRRTGQFVPTLNGVDTSPTSFSETRAREIATEQAKQTK